MGYWLIFFGGIGVLAGAILIPLGFHFIGQPKPFQQGQLETFEIDTSKPITINCGSNLFIVDYPTLKMGVDLKRFIFIQGFEYPIQIKSLSGQLSVSAWIADDNGNMVAHIIDNNWEVNPNNYFDRNFSNNAFEVVDKNKYPLLQVEIRGGNYLYIGGLFHYSSGIVLIVPEGFFINPSEDQLKNSIETLFNLSFK